MPLATAVATTIYTKNGRLWFHHLVPGDPPSSLSLDDLKDSEKVIDADLAAYYPALKKFDAQDSRLRHQSPTFLDSYLKGYKAPDLSVIGVLAELKKHGVEAKITGEDLFVWGKKTLSAPELPFSSQTQPNHGIKLTGGSRDAYPNFTPFCLCLSRVGRCVRYAHLCSRPGLQR